MSKVAVSLVKQLAAKKTGPDGKPMSTAELRVLKVLAWQHHDIVWCAWPKLRVLAEEVGMSQSHCRRILAGLEERGILKRYAVANERWGEATSNEYEFVGLGPKEVTQQMRDMVFEYRRTRSAVQLSLRRGGRKKATAGRGDQAQQSHDGEQLAGDEVGWSALFALADTFAVPSAVDMIAGSNFDDCGTQSLRLPIELDFELHEECNPPYAPPSTLKPVQAAPDRTVDGRLEMREANATAGATATAKTSALEAVEVPAESAVGPGTSSGGRVIPFRTRRERMPRRPARELDGVEAAFALEIEAVLIAAGQYPETSTRRTRAAIEGALRLAMAKKNISMAEAGEFLREMWSTFVDSAMVMTHPIGLRRFFGEGFFMSGNLWPWTIEAHQRISRSKY